MSTKSVCDTCGRTRPELSPVWLRLERVEAVSYREPSELDFCSWACVQSYAAAKMPQPRVRDHVFEGQGGDFECVRCGLPDDHAAHIREVPS